MCKAEKRKKNMPHIHLLDVFCGEESQAIKGNVQRCYRWRWKAKWMVNHRA